MSDSGIDDKAMAAARADWLRIAGQLHSGDTEGFEAVMTSLSGRPGVYAAAIVRVAATEYLTALHVLHQDPHAVQAWLDAAGLVALDQLKAITELDRPS